MVDEGMFEEGVSMIGAEQEMFLVDRAFNASPTALQVIEKVADSHFTTELGLFNLEMNADPQLLKGHGLSKMETQIAELYQKVKSVAAELHVKPVLTGILPTLQRTDLSLENMVPNPRYLTLNRVMRQVKGDGYDISIKGLDEPLNVEARLRSCSRRATPRSRCTSSASSRRSSATFTTSRSSSSRRRWRSARTASQLERARETPSGLETRITLFETGQVRHPHQRDLHARQDVPRVGFGKEWQTEGGVVGLFKENVTRYRPLVGMAGEEESSGILQKGGIPELRALRLHGGTVYRWNRAQYGISPNGKPHLRIELRVLPSGPSIADEVANAAFWIGLMRELTETIEDLPARMEFENAKQNFYNAAREGLSARMVWLDGEDVIAQPFILERLLPIAEKGLARGGVDDAEAKKYLGIIDKRVRSLHTGSRWALRSLQDCEAARRPTASRCPRSSRRRSPVSEIWAAGRGVGTRTARRAAGAENGLGARLAVHADGSLHGASERSGRACGRHHELGAHSPRSRRRRERQVPRRRDLALGASSRRVASASRPRALSVLPRSDSSTSLITEIVRHNNARTDSSPPPGSVHFVADIMRMDLVTIAPDPSTLDAIKLMRGHRHRLLASRQRRPHRCDGDGGGLHGHCCRPPRREDSKLMMLPLSHPHHPDWTSPLLEEGAGRLAGAGHRPDRRRPFRGPTLIAVCGIHGNERAGVLAAKRVLTSTPRAPEEPASRARSSSSRATSRACASASVIRCAD